MDFIKTNLHRLYTSVSCETWHPSTLFLFRMLLLFIVIGERSLILEIITVGEEISLARGATELDSYVVWFGHFVFDVDLSEARPTTKDHLYSWVHSASYLGLAGLGALLWTFVDRRKAHPLLKDGLWTLLRMFVAFYMFGYGCAKLYGVQFTSPSASDLMTELGAFSPSQFMKLFMGTSQPYSLLAGWLEIIGGILLCYRPTTLLGGLITLGVMSNVFALNLFYDFGMKRFSLELILLTSILLLPYIRRLIQWGLFNKPIDSIALYGPWTHQTWRWAGTGTMSLWMVIMLSSHASLFHQFAIDYAGAGPRGELDGTWEVMEMHSNGEMLPALLGDTKRWRSLTLEQSPAWSQATVRTLDGKRARWRLIVGDTHLELRSMTFDDDLSKTELKGKLNFKRLNPKSLQIQGEVEGVKIKAKLHYKAPKSFKLLSQPIRFIK